MNLEFYKYEGAGNDFILIDDRTGTFPSIHDDLVRRLCDRRFGIGADGLMLLRACPGYDFTMIYYNSDGRESTMCGNGGRCIAAFAQKLGIVQKKVRFMAIDGEHQAILTAEHYVRLKMSDVQDIESGKDYYYLNTGSPHYVTFVTGLSGMDVFVAGRDIRYNSRFREEGCNINFVEEDGESLFVRTYERGVENETLACGTGVVAAVISAYLNRNSDKISWSMPVKVMGGQLQVSFTVQDGRFTDIWLEGPATFVYRGTIVL